VGCYRRVVLKEVLPRDAVNTWVKISSTLLRRYRRSVSDR